MVIERFRLEGWIVGAGRLELMIVDHGQEYRGQPLQMLLLLLSDFWDQLIGRHIVFQDLDTRLSVATLPETYLGDDRLFKRRWSELIPHLQRFKNTFRILSNIHEGR